MTPFLLISETDIDFKALSYSFVNGCVSLYSYRFVWPISEDVTVRVVSNISTTKLLNLVGLQILQ